MKYKPLIIFVLSVVLFLGLGFSMYAQDEAAQDRGAEKAQQTLKKLPKAILNTLGLTEAEAAQTTRGARLKVFILGLDKLKAFQPGDKAKKVLIDTQEIVFPIYAGGVLKSSISLRKGEGGWKDASMGGAEIQFLEPVRMTHSKANNIDAKSYFIVRVPAMYLSFLGYEEKGELYLIPTHEHPDLNLAIGKSVPAEEVYLKIQPFVAKFENVFKPRKK